MTFEESLEVAKIKWLLRTKMADIPSLYGMASWRFFFCRCTQVAVWQQSINKICQMGFSIDWPLKMAERSQKWLLRVKMADLRHAPCNWTKNTRRKACVEQHLMCDDDDDKDDDDESAFTWRQIGRPSVPRCTATAWRPSLMSRTDRKQQLQYKYVENWVTPKLEVPLGKLMYMIDQIKDLIQF